MTTEIILIIIVGLLTMVAPILGSKYSGRFVGRLLWGFFIILVLGFMIGGIREVIQRAEKEKKSGLKIQTFEESYNRLVSKVDYIFKQCYKPETHQISMEFHNVATITQKARVIHANGQVDLKDRAEDLFFEIIKFLMDRESKMPARPRIDIFEADIDKIRNYYQDTMKEYSLKFGSRVIAIRNELANKGKQEKELDNYYRNPSNSNEIRIVAERIKALADQLP